MDIEVLAGELNRLVASDGFSISDKESLIALERFSAQLDCALSKAVASFEDGGEWAPDGAQTPVAWIATRCHVPKTEARRQLRLGRAMAHMPVVQKAWSKGDIGTAQVETLVKLRTVVTEESFGRDEAVLVEAAENLKFEAFLGVAKYWENMADPDGAKESDFERQARRNAYLVKDANGNWVGQLTLDPISGAIVSNELARIEQELFDADWAKAKAELGREPKIGELSRTSANRRADAVVEMATRSASTPADGRRPRPPGRLGDALWAALRAGRGPGALPRCSFPLARCGRLRAGRLCPGQKGRGEPHLSLFHRGDPAGHRAAGPRVHPSLLRPPGRSVPDRPHHSLEPRRADRTGERPGHVRLP
jgi:hypothetical protein